MSSWPEGSRLIVRRERPYPGAQLSFTHHDGHRFQAVLTDQQDQDIAIIERRHRQRARIEDRIRDDKDTGLALVRADSAGATHELADHCHKASMRFSFGYDLTQQVRIAILELSADAWLPALEPSSRSRSSPTTRCG